MNQTSTNRRQGPRRSADSRAAILDATRHELVENGWRKFSVDQVSRRAKASKQTIYRWWPAIGNMCIEAGLTLVPERSLRGRDPSERIADLIRPLEQSVQSSFGHSVMRGALLAASDDRDAGETWRTWLRDNVRAPLRLILAEIASKGVIRRDFDLDDALDILTGAFWSRVVVMRSPLPEGFSQTQADRLLSHLQLD